jgi:SagB-type dehydrogenase family enzyme
MSIRRLLVLVIVMVGLTILGFGGVMIFRRGRLHKESSRGSGEVITLPAPVKEGSLEVERALAERRSVREFSPGSLELAEVAQLLWAAQGVTDARGHRTAPSAGALYPLELLLVAGEVEGLQAGVYWYEPGDHVVTAHMEGDWRAELSQAALDQAWVREAPTVVVITAIYERTTGKYGQRGVQYVHMEVGAAAQNLYLQAQSLGLGTVFVGAFHDDQIAALLQLGEGQVPLALLPVGRR